MNMSINFPHLGIYLDHVGKFISVNGFHIAYYAIIMGCSILLGLYLAEREAKRTGQNPDTYTDLVIYAYRYCRSSDNASRGRCLRVCKHKRLKDDQQKEGR